MGSISRIFLVAFIILFTLYFNLRIIKHELRHHGEPTAFSHVRVFDTLKDLLPQKGVVGYVSDQNPTDSNAMWEHYQAEYALCPLLIVRDAKANYIIMYCHNSTDGNCSVNSGYVLVKEFNTGIRLYQQRKQ